MDFVFEDTPAEQYIHDVRLVEMQSKKEFYKKLGYIYIELPKFNKTENQLKTGEDKWLYCLKNMKTLDEIPVSLSKDPIFKKLFEVAEVSNLTPAEMSAYQKELKRKRDNYSHDQHMLQKGREEGEIEATKRERAKAEKEKREMACKLKIKGMPLEEISELTNLSIEEIQTL